MPDSFPADMQDLEIVVLDNAGDERGASYSLAQHFLRFVGEPMDMHVAGIRPGHIRGNHFHALRRELILVIYEDAWSFHWDTGADTEVSNRSFRGPGAVAIAIPQHAAHAIRNDGEKTLWLVATTDGLYDPAQPDAHPRIVAFNEA